MLASAAIALAGLVLWLAVPDTITPPVAASAAPSLLGPSPPPAPVFATYRQFVERALVTGCERVLACSPGAGGDSELQQRCADARRVLGLGTSMTSCVLDARAAAACVESLAHLACRGLDRHAWPAAIWRLPACSAVCAG